jgi:hypothetical protein
MWARRDGRQLLSTMKRHEAEETVRQLMRETLHETEAKVMTLHRTSPTSARRGGARVGVRERHQGQLRSSTHDPPQRASSSRQKRRSRWVSSCGSAGSGGGTHDCSETIRLPPRDLPSHRQLRHCSIHWQKPGPFSSFGCRVSGGLGCHLRSLPAGVIAPLCSFPFLRRNL